MAATKERKHARLLQQFQQMLQDNPSPELTNCNFLLPERPRLHKFCLQVADVSNTQPICVFQWFCGFMGQFMGKSTMVSIKEIRSMCKDDVIRLIVNTTSDKHCMFVMFCM